MITRGFAVFLLAASGLILAAAQTPPPPSTGIDYSSPASWLCLPGRQDACTVNLDTTIIAADGSLTKEPFHADPNAAIDCFYVYPTVSTDPGFNASITIGPEERNVVLQQFARFGSVCRLYAPIYRQVTLAGLRARLSEGQVTGDPTIGYHDVVDAWNEYLANRNHGRGVVLIGHSQGSSVLSALIANDIDGKPAQSKLISAVLMGASLQVPKGADIGGSFQHIPLCHTSSQTGCVIAFASYRADSPPPANTKFGRGQGSTISACVNPAALSGGSGELKSYFPAVSTSHISAAAPVWTDPPKPIDTPFVRLPGLLSAECASNEYANYLAIAVHPTPSGQRANQIPGDLVINGHLLKDWGLHLIDVNLTIGNLLDVVRDQTKGYLTKR